MAEGYIYLIWEEQFYNIKENVFKLGKSKEIFSRIMSGYPKGSKLLFTINCQNVDEVEKQLLIIFKTKYGLYNIENYEKSKERINANNYYSIINDIISYLNLFNNNELVVTTQHKEEQKKNNENSKKLKEEEKKLKEKEKEKKLKEKEEEKKLKEKEEEKKLKEKEEKKLKEKEKQKIKNLLNNMLIKHLKQLKVLQLGFKNDKIIYDFINNKIIKIDNPSGVNKSALEQYFKQWFQMNYGNRKAPKQSELIDVIIKKFGNKNSRSNKWHNIKIKEDEMVDLDD